MNAPMAAAEPVQRRLSTRAAEAEPAISVLIPFKGDDPTRLFNALARELNDPDLAATAEIVLYDDGSQSAALFDRVAARVEAAAFPATFISNEVNRGRSEARNRLFNAARGDHVLFLDADMIPDADDFLARWLEIATHDGAAIAFGGLSVDAAPASRETRLHRAFSSSSECPAAAERAANPAKYVYTSNLLVRREVFASVAFDEAFVGWGWEDVDWAARAGESHAITHIENPATHLGLETPQQLLGKFQRSAQNFVRFAQRHPQLARSLPSWKAARVFSWLPGSGLARPLFAGLARDRLGLTPMGVRILALKLWRASWYGEALR